MANFINKKERVLDVKLTPYGKQMFSKGKLKPSFYCFYDQDILYDGAYGGISEDQNDIVTRINSTQRLTLTTDFSGSGQNSTTSVVSAQDLNEKDFEKTTPSNAKFFRVLGKNSPWSDFYPAWYIRTIKDSNIFSGNYEYKSQLSIPTLKAELETVYEKSPVLATDEDGEDRIIDFHSLIDQDRLFLDVQELNTIFKANGNYEIEIFRMPDNKDQDSVLQKIKFVNNNNPKSDILLGQTNPSMYANTLRGTNAELEDSYPTLDETYVEYYLSVRVDDEIEDLVELGFNKYNIDPLRAPTDPCDI